MSPQGLWGHRARARPSLQQPALQGDRVVACSCVSPAVRRPRCLLPARPCRSVGLASGSCPVRVKFSVTLKYVGILRSRWLSLCCGGLLVPSESSGALFRIGHAVTGLGAVVRYSDLFLPRELPSGGGWHPCPSASPAPGRAATWKAFHQYLLDEFLIILATRK